METTTQTTKEPEPKYKYESAQAWLQQYLAGLGYQELQQEARNLASQLDNDTIQDIYQSDMDADGFFIPEGYRHCLICGEDKPEASFPEEDQDECAACIGLRPCDVDCAVHADDCDGYCDHGTNEETGRHYNACAGRVGLDGGKRLGGEVSTDA